MSSIHPSMLATASKELDALRMAQTVLFNIRSSKGWRNVYLQILPIEIISY